MNNLITYSGESKDPIDRDARLSQDMFRLNNFRGIGEVFIFKNNISSIEINKVDEQEIK